VEVSHIKPVPELIMMMREQLKRLYSRGYCLSMLSTAVG